MARVGEDAEKMGPCALLVGLQMGTATVENSMEVPQELKLELSYDPAIPLLGFYPKKFKNTFSPTINITFSHVLRAKYLLLDYCVSSFFVM